MPAPQFTTSTSSIQPPQPQQPISPFPGLRGGASVRAPTAFSASNSGKTTPEGELHRHFNGTVARRIGQYARKVLPASLLLRARRQRPPQPVVTRVRFCVESDASGVPLQPEPLREIELWCDLLGWGRVHIGNVPVPYDEAYKCAFPRIVEAVLHYVLPGVPPPADAHELPGKSQLPWSREAGGGLRAHARHVVSLELEEEHCILEAVEVMLHHPDKYVKAWRDNDRRRR